VDPGPALRAALCSGGRRIHVEVTDDGVRLRIRVGSRLREIAHLPSDGGHAMVRLLESTARNGVGVLQLDGGRVTVRYRLATCEAPSSKKLVLTVLPDRDEPAVRGVADLGVPEEIREALSADIAGRKGLVLAAGIPHSGRVRTLQALAAEADPTEESVLLLSFDGVAPTVSGYPAMTLDLRHELWRLMDDVESMDVDRFVMPELRTPLHATLAVALSGGRRLGFAPIRAQDTAGALVKMRELAADRYRVARDLVGVLAQRRLPRPCPECSERRSVGAQDLPESGWDPRVRAQILARAPGIRTRGNGCESCVGSGYLGWTYLYEYLSVSPEIAELLRSIDEPGRLREELKLVTAGRGLLDAAWREALEGNVEIEELGVIPGPEVVPFRPGVPGPGECLLHDDGAQRDAAGLLAEPVSAGEPADAVPALGPRLDHALYRRCYEPLRRVVAGIDAGKSEIAPLAAIAERVLSATKRDRELIHVALTAGRGDNLILHQLNVTILALRVAAGLRWGRPRLARLAMAALVHDVGLLHVPLRILQKEGDLSPKEEGVRRGHVHRTVEMLRAAFPGQEWLHEVAAQVHERASGRGFPARLSGDRIDPAARVIGLADALEALTHARPGRPASSAFEAIQFLLTNHAEDFDSRVFRSMMRQISPFPAGSRVLLNDGSTARVAAVNPDNLYRPKVEILEDAAGRPVARGTVLDLGQELLLCITGPAVASGTALPAGAGS
jgi:HD-GYP domain-containing protein (c-di-GMP phosphodiesterase class II)